MVSLAATLFTLGLFSAGMLTCREIVHNRSVGAVPHLPFVAASVNCALWLTYGLQIGDGVIMFVNSAGLVLQLAYLAVFHAYAEKKVPVRRDVAIATATICGVVVYFMCVEYGALVKLGLVCNFFTVCFFASPLATMAEVVRSRCTDTMSLPLSVMSLLTTVSWLLYGILISNLFVQVPNGLGMLLSVVQLSLFVIYRQRESTSQTNIV